MEDWKKKRIKHKPQEAAYVGFVPQKCPIVKRNTFTWLPEYKIDNEQQPKRKQSVLQQEKEGQSAPDREASCQVPEQSDAMQIVKRMEEERLSGQLAQVEKAKRMARQQSDAMQIAKRMEEERLSGQLAQVEKAKRMAHEQDVINHIMQENRVDVSSFVEEGMRMKQEAAYQSAHNGKEAPAALPQAEDAERKRQEELRLAQEVFERLQREAMEDEQKKQSEIEEAKRQAKEMFG